MEKFIILKKIKRKRKHGFRARMKCNGGQKTIMRRRLKGRSALSI